MQREISPCRVIYEDLVADLENTLRRILDFLGILVPGDFVCPETHLRKQADALSDHGWKISKPVWSSKILLDQHNYPPHTIIKSDKSLSWYNLAVIYPFSGASQ